MKMPTYRFGQYELRPALPTDLELATIWKNADPAHHEGTAEFWLEQNDVVNSFLLSDALGPLFFFKIERTEIPTDLKIHIQFQPCGFTTRMRTMDGLREGFAWLDNFLPARGFNALHFTSKNPILIQFCERRLGFTLDGDTLHKTLKTATA